MHLTIKGQPIPKKNSQEIRYKILKGKRIPFIAQSKAYETYEEAAIWQLKTQCRQLPGPPPYNIKCLFYRSNLIHCDTLNLQEAIDDILVRAGVIPDDWWGIVGAHDGSRVYLDRTNPRTEIYITRMEDCDERS